MTGGVDWLLLAEFSIVGVLAGGVLALIALGFVLVYKGTRVVNFAMGEFMMFGAYLFWTANVYLALPWWIALALSLAGIAILGAVVERFVLRPLAGQPVISIVMATIGLGAILHGVAEGVWGGANLALPQLLPRSPLMLGEILVPGQVLWSFALAVALIAGFTAYFHYSKGGCRCGLRHPIRSPRTRWASTCGRRNVSPGSLPASPVWSPASSSHRRPACRRRSAPSPSACSP